MHPAESAEQARERKGELQSLSAAIQHAHQAMADISDPDAKSQIAAAVNTLTTVQAKCHQPYMGPHRAGS